MLKKLLSISLFAALVLPLWGQHQRRVLIEEFTQASCGPCAAQNPSFNRTLAANADFVTPIKYQTSWPGFDPMNQHNAAEVATRVSYYAVTGVPNGRENGATAVSPVANYSAARIMAAYDDLTPVTINVDHRLSEKLDSVYVDVTVKSDDTLSGNLKLRVAITEENVIFDEAPGTNGEKEFFQIMKKMLPNATGTSTGNFSPGQEKTYKFAWKLANVYNLNEIAVVAFLQDDAGKQVWQSAHSAPKNDIPSADIKVAKNYTFACDLTSSPSFVVRNAGSNPTTSISMRYRVNNAAWVPYEWTGELAPDAEATITLTDVVYSQAALQKLDVEVIGSNNGIQTNMVLKGATIQTKVLGTAPTALPISAPFQAATLPVGWTAVNVGSNGWKAAALNVGFNSNRSITCNMFDVPPGSEVYLVLPKLDFSNAVGTTLLMTFDHAYAYYNNSSFDSLRIDISTDCSDTWTTVFLDGKAGLATAPATTSAFKPANADQWRFNEIDLTDFAGQSEVLVRLVGMSGFGNNLFIDNLNISSLVGVKNLASLEQFKVLPNPVRDAAQVRFNLAQAEEIRMTVYNMYGQPVLNQQLGNLPSGEHSATIDAATLPSGHYRVVLQSQNGTAQLPLMVAKGE